MKAEKIGEMTFEDETLTVVQITEDGPWSGMYEVHDIAGLIIATAITPQMAMAGAVEELEYFQDTIDAFIFHALLPEGGQ